jgi:hypothetical protein
MKEKAFKNINNGNTTQNKIDVLRNSCSMPQKLFTFMR